MKIVREIVEALRVLDRNSNMLPVSVTIDEAHEDVIAKKLAPVRDALNNILIAVECEGVVLSVDSVAECSPKSALIEIGIDVKNVLAIFEEA